MVYEGKFNYFVDGESKTIDEVRKLVNTDMTVSIDGLNVLYITPKQAAPKQAEEVQSQNGGRLDLDSLVYTFELGSRPIREDSKPKAKSEEFDWDDFLKRLVESMREPEDEPANSLFKTGKNVYGGVLSSLATSEDNRCKIPFDTLAYFKGGLEDVGEKETVNKLNYELDWNFIQQMAERMATNKGKYKPYNWQLKMNTDKLKQSLLRHTLEIMKGNDSDEGRALGHYESVALNAMMICYQIKNKL